MVRFDTSELLIMADYADGQARYLMHQDASENQRRAWVEWHQVAIADVLPPLGEPIFDEDDDGGEDDLGDGGWDWDFDPIIVEPWTGAGYESDWTLILDGAILD
jgi:hypothetical protein